MNLKQAKFQLSKINSARDEISGDEIAGSRKLLGEILDVVQQRSDNELLTRAYQYLASAYQGFLDAEEHGVNLDQSTKNQLKCAYQLLQNALN